MERTKIFISHAGADVLVPGKSGDTLHPVVSSLVNKMTNEGAEVFMSSNPKLGLNSAADLLLSLKNHIEDQDTNIFLVLITDNYLRSPFCIYELCLIQTEKQKQNREIEVHYIYANQDVEKRVPDIGIKSTVYCVLSDGEKKVKEFILKKENKIYPILKKSESEFSRFLRYMGGRDKKYRVLPCNKPYIGQTMNERNEINGYVEKVGIKRLASSGVYNREELKKHAKNAKAIYCISTTGAGLLKTLKEEILPTSLQNEDFQFHMILPPRNSAFCEDVAIAETQGYIDNEVITNQNKHRIYQEYEASIQYLNEAYLKAEKIAKEQNREVLGKIIIHNSKTLLRQTIFLTEERDATIWGWLSATLPPIRSIDSPDILFECSQTSQENQLGKFVLQHCKCLEKIAGEGYVINGRTRVEDIKQDDKMHLVDYLPDLNYWNWMYEHAQPANANGLTLIEIAAQHPLKNGKEPAEEFEGRLQEAIRLYRSLKNEKQDRIVKLYVPGSRHCENGKCDKLTLSQAGIEYLKKHLNEIEQLDILKEEDTNQKYMPNGVYNSMDECYVASEIYKELLSVYKSKEGQIICVCSPNQVMRKTFIYLRYGIEVMCHSVPIPGKMMYHNPVWEYFGSLHKAVYSNNDWQNPENDQFIESRKSRSPRSLLNP